MHLSFSIPLKTSHRIARRSLTQRIVFGGTRYPVAAGRYPFRQQAEHPGASIPPGLPPGFAAYNWQESIKRKRAGILQTGFGFEWVTQDYRL
jgi:hypothetical protein